MTGPIKALARIYDDGCTIYGYLRAMPNGGWRWQWADVGDSPLQWDDAEQTTLDGAIAYVRCAVPHAHIEMDPPGVYLAADDPTDADLDAGKWVALALIALALLALWL